MGVAKSLVYDSEGNGFTIFDLVEIFGKSKARIYELVRSNKCTKLYFLVKLNDSRVYNTKMPLIILSKKGKKYTSITASIKIGMSKSWVVKSYKAGYRTIEGLQRLAEQLEKEKLVVIKRKGFRRKICYRDNYMVECTYYESCMESRLDGSHHTRYKKDGSCFTTKQKIHNYPIKKDAGTWEMKNVYCPPANTDSASTVIAKLNAEIDGRDYDSRRNRQEEEWYKRRRLKGERV